MRLRLLGDREQAELHARRAVALDPVYGFAFGELAALRLPSTDDQDIEDGLNFARRATEHAPNHLWGWVYLGIAAWKARELDEAEDAFERACDLAPDLDLAWALYSEFVLKARRDPVRAQQLARFGVNQRSRRLGVGVALAGLMLHGMMAGPWWLGTSSILSRLPLSMDGVTLATSLAVGSAQLASWALLLWMARKHY